jgi:hypothetical protein
MNATPMLSEMESSADGLDRSRCGRLDQLTSFASNTSIMIVNCSGVETLGARCFSKLSFASGQAKVRMTPGRACRASRGHGHLRNRR